MAVVAVQRQGKETEAEWNARRTKSLAEIDSRLLTLVHASFQVGSPAFELLNTWEVFSQQNKMMTFLFFVKNHFHFMPHYSSVCQRFLPQQGEYIGLHLIE